MIILCLVFGFHGAFAAAALSLYLGSGMLGTMAAYVLGGMFGFGLGIAFGLRKRAGLATVPQSTWGVSRTNPYCVPLECSETQS